ncbi:MAG: Ger(x)C family spore germination protein [Peptococcaceae bacterium]|jgi:spore germination protein KC|nr:Ger(x)C family spore germination protein [Peptococcaceae bacterium]MDH7525896.1 Ger(x)C family spore germination protein [Peptococcaceae bacterium]
MKRTAVFLLLALLAVPQAGCWSRREINELAIVLGAGIDLAAEGQMRLTVQFAKPASFAGSGEGRGEGVKGASWVVSAEGKTVDEAAKHLAWKVPRDIYWSHCIVLVLGEGMAKKGIREVVDFFQRDREPRETMWVMAAKGEAKDFLETFSTLENTSAQAAGLINKMKTGCPVQLRELAEMLSSEGIQPVIPCAEAKYEGISPGQGQENAPAFKQVEIAGAGVFKEDKLIGWLDDEETAGLCWLKAKPVREEVSVKSPDEPDKKASVEIRRSKTRIKAQYDGNKLRYNIKITVEGDMVELQSREDVAEPARLKVLEMELGKTVETIIAALVAKAQHEFEADIFGFGEAFHRQYKKEWRVLKKRWDKEFAQAEVNIDVEAHIREIGLMTRLTCLSGK